MTKRDFIIRVGLGVFMFWFFIVGTLAVLDGQVFDFPNHKVIVADQGIHIYSKRISVEFKAGEE